MAQVKKKFSYLQDFFLVFIMFIDKACINYDWGISCNKSLRFRQNKNYKWIFSFFIMLLASDRNKLVKEFVY